MNRRMVNFLSSARLYLDQVPQDLHTIDGKTSKQTDIFTEWRRKQYDSSCAYRVLEALRNYAQHCGFPVHAMTLNFKREDTNAGSLMHAGLQLSVTIQNLKKDQKFKKGVLGELEAKADRQGYVNLTPLVREYVEKICEIHEAVRSGIAAEVASWDQMIISAVDRARTAFGGGFSGLSVVRESKDHEGDFIALDSADIYIAPIDWRKQLEAKNRDFSNLSSRYVTGQAGLR
jgi:hypothetical protein